MGKSSKSQTFILTKLLKLTHRINCKNKLKYSGSELFYFLLWSHFLKMNFTHETKVDQFDPEVLEVFYNIGFLSFFAVLY